MENKIWHKSYPQEVPKSLEYENLTMPEILARSAKKFSDRIALLFMEKKIRFDELDRLVNQFANALQQMGG